MNILYIAHRIPYPPNKGDKIRAFNEIKFFNKKHAVDVCCLIDTPKDKQYIKPLKKYCRNLEIGFINSGRKKILSIIKSFFSKKTCTELYFYDKSFHKKINTLTKKNQYDLIFLYCSSMFSYLPDNKDIPVIMDFVDIDSEKWAQYSQRSMFPINKLFATESRKLSALEHKILKQVNTAFLVTEKETDFFADSYAKDKVYAIPNGIDREFFNPDKVADDESLKKQEYICFTGVMDYFPNEDGVLYFCKTIFPLILKVLPNIKFYIVGSNPTSKVKALGKNKNIVVTGKVADVRPYLKHAKVAITPLRMARGIQNKILEAISMGLPVAATENAYEGLMLTKEKDILINDDPQKFANNVIYLLKSPDKRAQSVESAQKVLDKKYNWDKNLTRMEQQIMSNIKYSLQTK